LWVGAPRGSTHLDRGRRRIVVGYLVIGAGTRLIAGVSELSGVSPQVWIDPPDALISLILLGLLWRKPAWFVGIVSAILFIGLAEILAGTIVSGGLVPSEMVILWGVVIVLGALITLSVRAAFLWFVAYAVTLVLAVVLPERISPLEMEEGSPAGIAFTIMAVTSFVFAGMAYFVRQRDRFQKESDDLLHNILPDQIATRLKSDRTMIADDYESASVLFADVVDFTPMSAAMTPPELVGLLNTVFTIFDGFVAELGLEKIKTVGDAYMVAAGVPRGRPDHARAIAELALRMRDHTEHHEFDGRAIHLRIGINSGPVVAGIVGTHKFAYDLWGDVVNTASRMESGGIPGSIQVTPATYDLIRDDFACEPRGVVSVKGKGDMHTFVLVSRAHGD
jgi:guanylate cyclase